MAWKTGLSWTYTPPSTCWICKTPSRVPSRGIGTTFDRGLDWATDRALECSKTDRYTFYGVSRTGFSIQKRFLKLRKTEKTLELLYLRRSEVQVFRDRLLSNMRERFDKESHERSMARFLLCLASQKLVSSNCCRHWCNGNMEAREMWWRQL